MNSKLYQVCCYAQSVARSERVKIPEPMFEGNTTILALTDDDAAVLTQMMSLLSDQFELAEKLTNALGSRRCVERLIQEVDL